MGRKVLSGLLLIEREARQLIVKSLHMIDSMRGRHRWNLPATEWSSVLLSGAGPETIAEDLARGKVLPWTNTVLRLTGYSQTVLDLGSGRGEHAAVLALNGRRPTLLDWSKENLDFSEQVFDALGVYGHFCQADMTNSLPFESNSFDVVFSCGVLEFFADETVEAILEEALRVSKKRIILMVPNALCIPYLVGKWYMQRARVWRWGGEHPFFTLRPYLRRFANLRVSEFSVAAKHSLNFLAMPMGALISRVFVRLLRLRDHSSPALFRQGYLLVTVVDKIRNG